MILKWWNFFFLFSITIIGTALDPKQKITNKIKTKRFGLWASRDEDRTSDIQAVAENTIFLVEANTNTGTHWQTHAHTKRANGELRRGRPTIEKLVLDTKKKHWKREKKSTTHTRTEGTEKKTGWSSVPKTNRRPLSSDNSNTNDDGQCVVCAFSTLANRKSIPLFFTVTKVGPKHWQAAIYCLCHHVYHHHHRHIHFTQARLYSNTHEFCQYSKDSQNWKKTSVRQFKDRLNRNGTS